MAPVPNGVLNGAGECGDNDNRGACATGCRVREEENCCVCHLGENAPPMALVSQKTYPF